MDIKHRTREYAKNEGIGAIGFGSMDNVHLGKEDKFSTNYRTPFMKKFDHGRFRKEASDNLPECAKSFITIALPYNFSASPKEDVSDTGVYGTVSDHGRVRDYQTIVNRQLARLGDFINRKLFSGKDVVCGRNNVLDDRYLACLSAIGWMGEDHLIHVGEYGSNVFLGSLFLRIELESDSPLETMCIGCHACIEACPGGALQAGGVLEVHKCLSYLMHVGGTIPLESRKKIGTRLYGCSECQKACMNGKETGKDENGLLLPVLPSSIDLIGLIRMDEDGIKDLFRGTIVARLCAETIKRNAIVALGNRLDQEAIPVLSECLDDPSDMIREHARWAILRIKD